MRDGTHPMRLTRRMILGGLLGSAAGTALANAPLKSMRPLPRESAFEIKSLEQVVDQLGLSGDLSFIVADAETGEVLESRNPDQALPPASVAKAITALYALDALGPEHRFPTRLIATGPVLNGEVQGDLVLVGGGDPTLDTDALGEMARQLKERGVTAVKGAFKVHSADLPTLPWIDPGQPEHVGYNPSVSGLNLNYNRVHFEWKRAQGDYEVSMDARASKFSPRVDVARMTVVDRKGPVYTYADAGTADQWTVAKPALGSAGSRWLPVRKPEAYAAEVFQILARSHGIVLKDAVVSEVMPEGAVMAARDSEEMTSILRDMLLWSTNLTAEVSGLAASAARGAPHDTLQQSAQAMSDWAAETLDAASAAFVDHSGLGEASRISGHDMVRALIRARQQGRLPEILKAIPMRNDRGEPLQDHPVKVRAKTGTLNFVSSLAGYISIPGGKDLVFAYFSADLDKRARFNDEDEVPPGSQEWKGRSRLLQVRLINRWSQVFAA
jgi:D-alanyl-D-alanine carboxypeptidase/D-alanyl-D-alanine-endopeptidase (penicillin-binding protein 4)